MAICPNSCFVFFLNRTSPPSKPKFFVLVYFVNVNFIKESKRPNKKMGTICETGSFGLALISTECQKVLFQVVLTSSLYFLRKELLLTALLSAPVYKCVSMSHGQLLCQRYQWTGNRITVQSTHLQMYNIKFNFSVTVVKAPIFFFYRANIWYGTKA